jgi:hypothetical protein
MQPNCESYEDYKLEWTIRRADDAARLVNEALKATGGDREQAFRLLMQAAEKAGSYAADYWMNRAMPPLGVDQ